jgi:hypothetical protein
LIAYLREYDYQLETITYIYLLFNSGNGGNNPSNLSIS